MKKIVGLSEKLDNGSMGEMIPIGAEAKNIDLANGKNAEVAIEEINSKLNTQDGNISGIITKVAGIESNISNLQNTVSGKAPTIHTSTDLKYGGGTSSSYGHVKLTDSYTASAGTADSSIGASQKAVNEAYKNLDGKMGSLTSLTTSTKTNLVSAVNEVDKNADTAQSTANTANSTANAANGTANANKTNIGSLNGLTTDAKTNLVNAINEVDSHANTAQSTANTAKNTADSANSTASTANSIANTNKTNIGTLTSLTTSTKTNLVSAVNEVDKNADTAVNAANTANGTANANKTNIGTLGSLTTDAKTNLVNAINEVDSHADTANNVANSANSTANAANSTANTNKTNIGTLSSLKTSNKTSIVNATNELHDKTIGKTLKTLNEVSLATQQGFYVDALAVKELYREMNTDLSSYFSLGWPWQTVSGRKTLFVKIGNIVFISFTVHPEGGFSANKAYTVFKNTLPEKYKPMQVTISPGVAANGDLTYPSHCSFLINAAGDIQITIGADAIQNHISGYFSCNMFYVIKGE